MTNLRSDFTCELERKTLREICCEARQACWKSDKTIVFKVGEKELKNSDLSSPRPAKKLKLNEKNGKENSIMYSQVQHTPVPASDSTTSTIPSCLFYG